MQLSDLLKAIKLECLYIELKDAMKKEQMHLQAKMENPGKVLTPCGNRKTLLDSFEMFGDKLAFWYNIDKDTKAVLDDDE